ncbi:hypothetical protein [Streptomyces sp. H34-S4]|uniref:hypothetical protein n=1 Tax=Streptomyces sp. H34-S4 TaxID=2996463 RepID=UPI0022716EDD|nr:hypothetical protein [Streptomyces sp. H34-S4]MCY0937639.1 hypothetical protein [Streptomyces sp. H34-S4]
MEQLQLPVVRAGERVVTRPDGKGGLILTVERIRGREFVADETHRGYVLDARLLMDILGSLKMPGSYFQTWCKLVSLQDTTAREVKKGAAPRGYIRATQRDLQSLCGLSAASVNEASQFVTHLGWMRTARRGIHQLNPWLTVAGTSGEQELWQAEWNAAGGPVAVIPAPNYPAEWRALREAERKAEKAAKLAALRSQTVVPLPRRRKAPAAASRESA